MLPEYPSDTIGNRTWNIENTKIIENSSRKTIDPQIQWNLKSIKAHIYHRQVTRTWID